MKNKEAIRLELENLTAEELLETISQKSENVVFSTSFGKEDQVITDLIARKKLPIRIFTLDTGRLFEETYAVFDRTVKKYGVPIHTYYPETPAVQKLVSEKGPYSFYDSVENRKECCGIRKIEPLKRALADADIWITGLRAEQSANREKMEQIEWDGQNKVLKIHPLFFWGNEKLEAYIETHSVPVNTLHAKGFPSIGCSSCTRAIVEGEDERAGRWWWEVSKKECGLHQSK